MTERVYRPFSPTRDLGPAVFVSADEAQGVACAMNQGASVLDLPQDWRVQSSVLNWCDHDE